MNSVEKTNRLNYDKDSCKKIYGTENKEELKQLLWQEIKKVNKTSGSQNEIKQYSLVPFNFRNILNTKTSSDKNVVIMIISDIVKKNLHSCYTETGIRKTLFRKQSD